MSKILCCASKLAITVKIADIKCNLATLPANEKTKTRLRTERYELAIHVLEN